MIRSQQPTTSVEGEVDQISWEETVLGRSPSVSNLRVSECRRRFTGVCWLNLVLLFTLMIAIAVILYFVVQPYIQARNYQAQTVVNTLCGTLQGFVNSDGIITFLGIPYALAPVGPNRFKRPVELTTQELCKQAWGTNSSGMVHLVTQYKSPCMQLEPITDKLVGNEDCLYANVFVPISDQPLTPSTARPVIVQISGLFFLYGGSAAGLSVSAGQQPHARTVRTVDAIHVTFNHRIGPLGFLTHPRTKQPNLGLYDQLALLRWIRSNIGAFGGDPTRVTLFGYGSGATCALALSQSLLGHSLFDRLWISAPALGLPKLSLEEAVTHSEQLFECNSSLNASCEAGYLNDGPSILRLWSWFHMEPWLKQALVGFSPTSPVSWVEVELATFCSLSRLSTS
ncbi:Para nitrobenzyl esterase [Fasciola gigantica]|uniref:Para nitrobenzyl esterase n=1 Tax=Fasciola gigantica TaxID=46835 RepID=A0A504Y4B5_FASGI|nr:Para nitrobenzyl esterase [Fasciola gigantica]